MELEPVEVVWIIELNTWGIVVQRHAYTSVVKYPVGNMFNTDTFENEELLEWGDAVNDHE